jgi:hypothetical protein
LGSSVPSCCRVDTQAQWYVTTNLCFHCPQHLPIEPPHAIYTVVSLSHPYIPRLICSLPSLEDLTVADLVGTNFDDDTPFQPATSPPLTGTLTVVWSVRLEHLVTRLLSLPNGIHFRKFKFLWEAEPDVRWVMALVDACSDTLEHIDLEARVDGESRNPWNSTIR